MSDYAERIAISERMDRTVKMARTYLRKAEGYLHPYRVGSEIVQPLPPSVAYWDLLDQALETALAIVKKLPDDFFEATEIEDVFGLGATLGIDVSGKHNSSDEPLAHAQNVIAAIEHRRNDAKRRRKIAALENVEGRTDAEAEVFRAGAERLRRNG